MAPISVKFYPMSAPVVFILLERLVVLVSGKTHENRENEAAEIEEHEQARDNGDGNADLVHENDTTVAEDRGHHLPAVKRPNGNAVDYGPEDADKHEISEEISDVGWWKISI